MTVAGLMERIRRAFAAQPRGIDIIDLTPPEPRDTPPCGECGGSKWVPCGNQMHACHSCNGGTCPGDDRLSDAEFRVVVRRELGYEHQKNVADRDIDEMRVVVNRHGSDDPRRAADLLWNLMRGL